MPAPIWVALFALIAACVGPLITYIAANRKLSGKINTSEAESLWAESASIREDYRARLDQANARISALEKGFTECERRNIELERQAVETLAEIQSKVRVIDTLQEANEELTRQMAILHTQLKVLRGSRA